MTRDLLDVAGVLLDVDGTLAQDGKLLPGVSRAVGWLRERGTPLRFVTNTSRRPRRVVLGALRSLGLEAQADEVITAPVAAAGWLEEASVSRVALLAAEELAEDFSGLTLVASAPEAVVVGDLGRSWSYELLDRAFGWILGGARLVAIQKNRYWKTGGGLHLDAGPFVAALEYATGREATVAGKPSRLLFERAAASMGLKVSDLVMVGDDLEADVRGAIECGAAGVLVRTGKFREEDLEDGGSPSPDAVLDSVDRIAELLGA